MNTMPIYDYRCPSCRVVVTVSHETETEPVIHCPKCKGACQRYVSDAVTIRTEKIMAEIQEQQRQERQKAEESSHSHQTHGEGCALHQKFD